MYQRMNRCIVQLLVEMDETEEGITIMSKAKEQKTSSVFSVPRFLLMLIALAGLVVGIWMLVRQGSGQDGTQTPIAMKVGDTRTLETVLGADFTCSISDDQVAYIDEAHLITAKKAGTASIVAQAPNGERQLFQLTVTGEGTFEMTTTTETTTETTTTETTTECTTTLPEGSVTGIELTFYSVTLKVGEKKMPIVTMFPADADDKSEKWTSTNEKVATVDWLGNITAVAPGTCTVRVTSVNNPNVYAEVAVTVTGNTAAEAPIASVPTEQKPQNEGRPDITVIDGVTYVNGILIANKTYGLPESYNPGLLPETQAAFEKMQAAAKADGLDLTIASGFRSYELQKNLYNKYVTRDGKEKADTYSARPGHSEHQTGLAMDINKASDSFHNTPEAKWLAENCWKYGFIIRYPEGKQNITGYKYESWHVRYLGEELAKTVYDSGKTLEEYLGITSVYAD